MWYSENILLKVNPTKGVFPNFPKFSENSLSRTPLDGCSKQLDDANNPDASSLFVRLHFKSIAVYSENYSASYSRHSSRPSLFYNTSARHKWHKCDMSETRVRHEQHQCDTVATREKIFDFDNDTSENFSFS